MAESSIQLPPDDPGGKKLRTETVDLGAGEVHQEVLTLAAADGVLLDVIAGRAQVDVAGVIAISNPTTDPETGLAKDATLTPAKGFKVRDDWASGELLAEQNGAGAVLTFTFATAVDFIWVTDIGSTTTNICHVDPFGGAPTASLGIPVPNLAATPIYVTPAATVIKIHAPAGAVVNVVGYRRA